LTNPGKITTGLNLRGVLPNRLKNPAVGRLGGKMDQKCLDVWLQAQTLISEREGMIAENKQREYRGQGLAYTEEDFKIRADAFQWLLTHLRK
jgi:hypothetical protein